VTLVTQAALQVRNHPSVTEKSSALLRGASVCVVMGYFISLVTHFCICMSFCGLSSFMVPNFPSLVVCLKLASSSSHVIASFIILMTYTFAVVVGR